MHDAGAAEKFYWQCLAGSRIGKEATGNCQWPVELVSRLGHELWMGDAAKIRASDARQQEHDKRHRSAVAVAGGRTVSADLGTFPRPAAAADSSLQAGAASCASEERTAAPAPEPGTAEEKNGCGMQRDRSSFAFWRNVYATLDIIKSAARDFNAVAGSTWSKLAGLRDWGRTCVPTFEPLEVGNEPIRRTCLQEIDLHLFTPTERWLLLSIPTQRFKSFHEKAGECKVFPFIFSFLLLMCIRT